MTLFDDLFENEPDFDPDDTPVSPFAGVAIEVVTMIRPSPNFAIWSNVIKPSQRYDNLIADGYREFVEVQE